MAWRTEATAGPLWAVEAGPAGALSGKEPDPALRRAGWSWYHSSLRHAATKNSGYSASATVEGLPRRAAVHGAFAHQHEEPIPADSVNVGAVEPTGRDDLVILGSVESTSPEASGKPPTMGAVPLTPQEKTGATLPARLRNETEFCGSGK
ncbi:hypothetical protein GCM10009751_20190 [Myceligenerans crystallogenes]|uniref:Uncharacterized protein n=1 Tax=Myceligenerans crystallogenes TaxID=316335 RepID=A0ABN2ND65_9MICO